MGKVTEEELLKNLDFKCVRCSRECQKSFIDEPELGYIDNDNNYVGPICKDCHKEMPAKYQARKEMAETAFLIVIKPNGEGAVLSTDGIELQYRRDATFADVFAGCTEVLKDIGQADLMQKMLPKLAMMFGQMEKAKQQQPKNKLVLPR